MPFPLSRGLKGKMRARDDGPGKAEGIILDMKLVGDGTWVAAYTIPVQVGDDTFHLQVDTGSSDMWIASSSCNTDPCKSTKGHTYDPGDAQLANRNFTINYLIGDVSGPIVWDSVELGGYEIDYQALSAASSVTNEPLSPDFAGILGLALPANSIIAREIVPTTSDAPDGATFASNLFGITPISDAPGAHFISMLLERPGSDRVPSVLGIGRHPTNIIPDPSKIKYTRLVSENVGPLFWKTNVQSLSVWVDSVERSIDLGRSHTGSIFPTATIDSGVPVILTTSTIANAIYGAVNVGPGSDGNYYIPCTTPLNISITIDSATVPVHPLDLTTRTPNDVTGTMCMGLIQAADGPLSSGRAGDFILGVPFLRNTYTVYAHAEPSPNGTFPTLAAAAVIVPRLGVLPITDPKVAMDEFTSVRVNNRPLKTNSTGGGSSGNGARQSSSHGMPVGLKVFAGIAGFFVLCALLFLARWLLVRRKFRRAGSSPEEGESAEDGQKVAAYGLVRRGSGGYGAASLGYGDRVRSTSTANEDVRDETLNGSAAGKWDKESKPSGYTRSSLASGVTRIGESDDEASPRVNEFGAQAHHAQELGFSDPWDPRTAIAWSSGAATVTPTHKRTPSNAPLLATDPLSPPTSPHQPAMSEPVVHARRPSDTPESSAPETSVWRDSLPPGAALPTHPAAVVHRDI